MQTKKFSYYGKDSALTINAIGVWFVASLFTCFQFCTQVITGPMNRELMAGYNLNAVGLSYAVSSFFYAYLFMQLPAGIILDRYPNRHVMTIACFICAVGCVGMGVADNIYFFVMARMFCGLGAAFGFIGTMRILRNYFPIRFIALFIGFTEMLGFFVTASCENLASYFLPLVGFKKIFLSMGILGLIITACISLVMHKRFAPKHEFAPPVKEHNLGKDLLELVGDRQLWILGLIAFSFFSLVTAFAALWGVPALMSLNSLSLVDATHAISCIFIGIAFGGPLLGYLSTKIPQPRLIIFICGLICAALIYYLAIPSNGSKGGLNTALFICGFLSCCYLLSFSIATEITPARLSGVTMGFINMITMTSALIMQPILGYLVSLDGAIGMIDGAPLYGITGYQRACWAVAGLFLLASCLSVLLPRQEVVNTQGNV